MVHQFRWKERRSIIATEPHIEAFFDEPTFTVSYLVSDPATGKAAAIDSVLAFDPKSARTSTAAAERLLQAALKQNLTIDWILETHAHADHLSAAQFLKDRTGAPVATGEHIREVQKAFGPMFDATDVTGDGAPFDRLLTDGEGLPLGSLEIQVLFTPGHTAGCVSYRIGSNVFVGDTLFMPDYGTARTDFPGGDPRTLYRSIRKLLSLPPETTLWMCHDYKAPGRDSFVWQTTVAEQRARNIHIHDGISEDEFAAMRAARDKTLATPVLLLPSVQVNIRAGRMPPPDPDGHVYLRLPVNRL
jgi:glyoxylase-like metal-dependent hydrolase (beta-lactamase superfamily II)